MAKIMRVARKSGIVIEIMGDVHVYIPEGMTGSVMESYFYREQDGLNSDDITVRWDHAFYSDLSDEDSPKTWIEPFDDPFMMSKNLVFVSIEESPEDPA